MSVFLFFVLSGIGAGCRYLIRYYFPYSPVFSTLLVNSLGGFLIGILFTYTQNQVSGNLNFLLSVAFLGSLTTFSTFSLDTMNFILEKSYMNAALNVFANNLLALSFCFLGMKFQKFLWI